MLIFALSKGFRGDFSRFFLAFFLRHTQKIRRRELQIELKKFLIVFGWVAKQKSVELKVLNWSVLVVQLHMGIVSMSQQIRQIIKTLHFPMRQATPKCLMSCNCKKKIDSSPKLCIREESEVLFTRVSRVQLRVYVTVRNKRRIKCSFCVMIQEL
jgi:hypothetical protein